MHASHVFGSGRRVASPPYVSIRSGGKGRTCVTWALGRDDDADVLAARRRSNRSIQSRRLSRARARGPSMKTGWRARRRRCALLLTTVRRTNRSSHRSFLAAVWHAARRRVEVACPRALRPGCCVACFPPHCCGHVRSTAGWRCRNGMRCDALRTCVGARV
jgi:hypothetical protein